MPATSFADMPTLATSSSSSNQQPFHRRRKSWARKVERCICSAFTLFPLVFVYGLTTWAVWVEVTVSMVENPTWHGYSGALLGFVLYLLANVSYTTAVFTSPGSPSDPKQDLSRAKRGGGYQGLPTYENDDETTRIGTVPSEWMTAVTAKSTGKPRYCKKCRVVKPDRTHHCSTCGRCVLKMDHHCPWLATCVGLHNYKPFLLFLIYVCLLCYVCFAISAYWVWIELTNQVQMTEGMRVVNTLLLAVLSGIIGLVLSGFLGWHLYLTATGQTTIESLEKTRYLSPLRKSLQTQSQAGRNYIGQDFPSSSLGDDQPLSDRLKEIHANALPGVLRPEEGDVPLLEPSHNTTSLPRPLNGSPAHESLQRSYASLEAQREQDRYNQYLDEQDSEKLPNAFDLGWRRNLLHVFGPNPLLWGLPIRNTSGDGWQWDVSPKWLEARERISRERQSRQLQQQQQQQRQQHDFLPPQQQQQAPEWRWNPGSGFVDQNPRSHQASLPPPPSSSGGGAGGLPQANDRASVQMQALDRRKMDLADGSGGGGGGDENDGPRSRPGSRTANWNDVPEDFLDSRHGVNGRSRSRGRRKGD